MMERLSVKNAFSTTTSSSPTNSLTTANTLAAIKPIKKEILSPLSRQARVGSSASASSMDSTLTSSSSMQQLYNNNNRKSYPNSDISASFSSSVAGSIQDDNIINDKCSLTQSEVEEYSRTYFGQQVFLHQKQSSYAQSEGYHSYVSSSDSSSATPFLDRLRQESELLSRSSSQWSQSPDPSVQQQHLTNNNIIATSASSQNNSINNNSNHHHHHSNNHHHHRHNNSQDNNSSESTSSTETLKWLGSMSDVSVASHTTNSSAISGSVSQSQLIVHSSRVRTPKRHNSESVLYLDDDKQSLNNNRTSSPSSIDSKQNSPKERSSRSNNRLFPVGTYTETDSTPTSPSSKSQASNHNNNNNNNWQSVADRINELERHHFNQKTTVTGNAPTQKYTYLDPSKTTRVPNPALKAFQKNAVQSYFERQQLTTTKESTVTPIIRATANSSVISSNGNGAMRPQSLPVNSSTTKVVSQSQSHLSSRSSLPNNYQIAHAHLANTGDVQKIPSSSSSSSVQPQLNFTGSPAMLHSSMPTQYHMAASVYNGGPTTVASIATVIPVESNFGSAVGANNICINGYLSGSQSMDALKMVNESGVPPPPPRRGRSMVPLRRTSSASEYAAIRDQTLEKQHGLSKDLLGPMVMGPIISLDDWVPERPPKNPMLRIPSPDLPPPPPAPTIVDDDDAAVIAKIQDEPLPPPPPELMRHMRQLSEPENKSATASRRNSFAGSSNKKPLFRASTVENLSPPPPAIPKKPTSMDRLNHSHPHHHQRPMSSLAKFPPPPPSGINVKKSHKVVLNGSTGSKVEGPNIVPSPPLHGHGPGGGGTGNPGGGHNNRPQNDTRMSIRKRSHNAPMPLLEIPPPPPPLNKQHHSQHYPSHHHHPHPHHNPPSPMHNSNFNDSRKMIVSPPPLKPRIAIIPPTSMSTTTPSVDHQRSASALGNRLRCNSKASYLPRQSREKLSDPDHGSYKLTLTSNEDSINHDDILGAKCQNLPDVLPVNVKMQSTQRYGGSYNNLNNTNILHHHNGNNLNSSTCSLKSAPQTAPIVMTSHNGSSSSSSSSYSMKSMFHFTLNNNNRNMQQQHQQHQQQQLSYGMMGGGSSGNRMSSTNSDSISPKYMSQSTIDLKKTHIINNSNGTNNCNTIENSRMQMAESETNVSVIEPSMAGSSAAAARLSPYAMRSEFIGRKLSFDEHQQFHQQQQTAVVAPIMISNSSRSTTPVKKENGGKPTIRKDSLKENIDKITQLQCKLMSGAERSGSSLVRDSSFRSSSGKSDTSKQQPPPLPLTPPPQLVTDITQMVDNRTVAVINEESTTSQPVVIIDGSDSSHTNVNELQNGGGLSDNCTPPIKDSDCLNVEPPTTPKLLQRTEIVLRLNAPTAEASCQTDDNRLTKGDDDDNDSKLVVAVPAIADETKPLSAEEESQQTNSPTPTVKLSRAKYSVDIDCEKLSKELVSQLSPSDRLHHILAPKVFKSSLDYVDNLFNPCVQPRLMKKDAATSTPPPDADLSCESSDCDLSSPKLIGTDASNANIIAPMAVKPKPSYTANVKQFAREMATLVNGDAGDLTQKKEILVERIAAKLSQLAIEQTQLTEEATTNDLLGVNILEKVTQACRPVDASKFRSYIADVGHITMLLLSLSGRLARTENLLQYCADDGEKKTLETKRTRLSEQLDEAKHLKGDIDRRGVAVGKCLEKHLSANDFVDYDYFINMKAKLIVDGREIVERIQMGEEQIVALKDTLVQSEC